jgi:uncharacterized protein YbjT (DUF2867 family)
MSSTQSLILGATGLVGNELISLLLEKENKVRLLLRRKLDLKSKKIQQIVLEELDSMTLEHFKGVVTVYCCLGTTIKTAKTKDAFKKVDYEYPLMAARLAKEAGVKNFICISAKGSSIDSAFFYPQVKGELERDLKAVGIEKLHIVRPSLLIGERSEFRLGEAIGQLFSKSVLPLLKSVLGTYSPIEAKKVAFTMWELATYGMHTSKNIEVESRK